MVLFWVFWVFSLGTAHKSVCVTSRHAKLEIRRGEGGSPHNVTQNTKNRQISRKTEKFVEYSGNFVDFDRKKVILKRTFHDFFMCCFD